MSTLVVVAYNDPFKAEEIRLKFQKVQSAHLIDLDDAVVAIKNAEGKVKLDQMHNLSVSGALSGGFWGTLIGLLFLSPLLGLVVGATAGATGALRDVGINDQFVKELADTLRPGSSALFVLVRKATPGRVLDELKGTGGKILQTSLSHEQTDRLQNALAEAA
jgi:uncharacterized membrane protein